MRVRDLIALREKNRSNGHHAAPAEPEVAANPDSDPSVAEPASLPPAKPHEAEKPKRVRVSLKDLRAMEFPPIPFVVGGILPTGLTIISGAPKAGKSFLALQIAVSVATGESALGALPVSPGAVLYLALEDTLRRLSVRARELYPEPHPRDEHLSFDVLSPQASEGGLGDIREWVSQATEPRLVIIDTFQRFRDPSSGSGQTYERDYSAVAGIKKIADETGVAILLIHHTRKSSADNAFDETSGTRGITGAADTMIVMDRSGDVGTLLIQGRDIPETTVTLSRDGTRWKADSSAMGINRPAPSSDGLPAKLQEAVDWLRDLLKDGPEWVREIREAATKKDIPTGYLYKARDHLKIIEDRAQRSNDGRGRELLRWSLPEDMSQTPNPRGCDNVTNPPGDLYTPENQGRENCHEDSSQDSDEIPL